MGNLNKEYLKSFLKSIIKSSLAGLLLAFLITRIILPTKIIGSSMYPTLKDGNYVLTNRLDKDPDRKSIIVFSNNILDQEYLVKRVIAIGGDKYKLENGEVFINGCKIDEPYIKRMWADRKYSGIVPEGYIFVMGDNRNHSIDSRSFGLIEVENVIGKVLFK